jgi:tRNA threonylcarbamoyladenosine biosynthesis protein TsaB
MPLPATPQAAACVLAFDTSTERLAVAVAAQESAYTCNAAGGAAASATLLPQVQALLAQAGLVYADLQAVAFGCGPGAFTGLRTACAVAQGLGYGLGLPLLPIDSLLIVAEDARLQVAPDAPEAIALDVAVAMDARMDEVYAARYRWQGGRWAVLQAPALYTLAALQAAWQGVTVHLLAGSALQAFGPRLVLADAPRVEFEADRAAALLRLAVAAAKAGPGVAAHQALPVYLRDKVAQTTQERDAARLAKAEAAAAASPLA